MLADFDKAFADFERDAYSLLHESHFDPGTNLASFKVQIQAQSLATDVGYLAMVMRDLHQAAIREVSDEMDRDNTEYQAYLAKQMEEVGSNLVLDDKLFRDQPRRETQDLDGSCQVRGRVQSISVSDPRISGRDLQGRVVCCRPTRWREKQYDSRRISTGVRSSVVASAKGHATKLDLSPLSSRCPFDYFIRMLQC